ncbi:AraC family transcriptional regulator [Paenibacillus eucommiae]|uniref:AraC-like DNA-binding protein n=1 Tax=Paenibacillus eucommiae TaxID=1355755 RepID=A0ABS4IS59_9BACL|nr:AraC family transcriptional regulator [Paenibacillus eucommiae]MBP1990396.1 AraC-like DNA-binding protein [Paenibacillus eucommiae]
MRLFICRDVNDVGSWDHSRQLSLRYAATEELKIDSWRIFELPNHEDYRFGYVLKEQVKLTLEAGGQCLERKLLCGELFLVTPNLSCKIHNSTSQAAHIVIIHFQCDWGGNPAAPEAGQTPFFPCFSEQEEGVGKLRKSESQAKVSVPVHSQRHSQTQAQLQSQLQLYTLRVPQAYGWIQDFLNDSQNPESVPVPYFQLQSHLYAIAAAFQAHVHKPRSAEDDLHDYVKQTRQYILEKYNRAVDIEEVARLSGASSSRFYQAFKRTTGLSPNKFITMTRLNVSLYLLSASSSSVMEVAHSVGYPDELYFSRLFKKHMGLSPTEYTGLAKKRIANLSPVFQGDLSVLGIVPKITLQRGWSEHPESYIRLIENSNPELILTSPIPDELYRTLSKIAPVLMLYWKTYSWKERLLKISRVLDMPTIAERWLTYFDMKVENARFHIHRHLGSKPFLLVGAAAGRFRVFGMQGKKMKDFFYDDLQVTPAGPAEHIRFLDVTSIHEVAALDCENVLFLVQTSESDDFCTQLEKDWRRLKGNRRNQNCLFVRHEEPLLYNAAVHESLIDQTVQLLQNQ